MTQPKLRRVALRNVTPLLYPESLGNKCAQFNSPSLLSHFPPYVMGFDIKRVQSKNLKDTLMSHCHHCYCCNVDFVLFLHVACYTNSMLSDIHANTTNLHPCTLVATCMILGRLECSSTDIVIQKHAFIYSSPTLVEMQQDFLYGLRNCTILVQYDLQNSIKHPQVMHSGIVCHALVVKL